MMRPRNWLYHTYILAEMKTRGAGRRRRAVGGGAGDRALGSRSVREYDDRFIAPRYGFRGADDYYELCTPLSFMPEIRVPTLVLAAGDDPWIPGASTIATSIGRTIRSLLSVMAEGGGHVGFHSADSDRPWSDTVLEKFLERV